MKHHSLQIRFEGIRGSGYKGDIAIDDITVVDYDGTCPVIPSAAVPWGCNFELGFCEWQQLKTDDFDWRLHKGLTGTVGTGPRYDHTTNTSNYSPCIFLYFHVLHIFKFHRGKFLLTTTKHSPKAQFRSSRLEVFHKKGVLKNFTKFKGKHFCECLSQKYPIAGVLQNNSSECIKFTGYTCDGPLFSTENSRVNVARR